MLLYNIMLLNTPHNAMLRKQVLDIARKSMQREMNNQSYLNSQLIGGSHHDLDMYQYAFPQRGEGAVGSNGVTAYDNGEGEKYDSDMKITVASGAGKKDSDAIIKEFKKQGTGVLQEGENFVGLGKKKHTKGKGIFSTIGETLDSIGLGKSKCMMECDTSSSSDDEMEGGRKRMKKGKGFGAGMSGGDFPLPDSDPFKSFGDLLGNPLFHGLVNFAVENPELLLAAGKKKGGRIGIEDEFNQFSAPFNIQNPFYIAKKVLGLGKDGKKPRKGKKGGNEITATSIPIDIPDPSSMPVQVQNKHGAVGALVAGKKKKGGAGIDAWRQLVKEITSRNKCGVREAIKYIKENNLYKK